MQGTFGRVVTAMITPFAANGGVDHDAVGTLVDHLLDNGTETIAVAGTTGESPTLSQAEKLALFASTVEAVRAHGSGQVIAGTSSSSTTESVELTAEATDIGVDGILAVSPYYNRPPQRGLIAHFTAIADATDKPVIIYDIPARTGVRVELDTMGRLSRHPRIVGVKDATGSPANVAHIRAQCGPEFDVYSGDDAQTLAYLAFGACGVVSVASHVAGRQIADMIALFAAGDIDAALERHEELAPLFAVLFEDASPIPVKAAVEIAGLRSGRPRLPLMPIEPELEAKLRKIVVPFVGKQ